MKVGRDVMTSSFRRGSEPEVKSPLHQSHLYRNQIPLYFIHNKFLCTYNDKLIFLFGSDRVSYSITNGGIPKQLVWSG